MQAPLFELSYINQSGTYRLEDDIGKIIVLTFWTSWCPDCAVDLPLKEKLSQSLQNDNVKMVTINVKGRERDPLAALKFAEKNLTQLTLIDNGREVYDNYQSLGVPTTVVINSDGQIHEKFGDKSSFLDIVTSIGQLIN